MCHGSVSCVRTEGAPPPTRRLADVLVAAIREATAAELAERGYAGVTFEGVARRARTSKPVLYRRYRSRAHLVADALTALLLADPPVTTTGTLRGDLVATLLPQTELARRIGGENFRALLGEADDTLVSESVALNIGRVVDAVRTAIGAAVARGELGPGTIPDRAILAPVILLRTTMMWSSTPPATEVERVVDDVALPLFRQLAG